MTSQTLAMILLLAPLVAFAVALVGFRNKHNVSAGIVILSGVTALVSALWLLATRDASPVIHSQRWFTISGFDLQFGALLDGRTLVMGAVVTVVTLCVQVYSLVYMSEDPGRGRFFAFLALFEWAMLSFVYAPNLLQTFIFWELVGLASFLLIGFWYQKPSAVAAAKKAFLMTRIGDVGLFIGLILLFQNANTLDVLTINATAGGLDSGKVELIAGLLFVGIIGKSAKFPLHTWLPDAMEGPTPVSALLHSATMVAAGVFLFARFFELFMQASGVLTVVLTIAAVTAVLASTMAMVAKDIKRVLAFSSISQLGFMLMGLAAGNLYAGMFHLVTHAAFKALLFLCAGAYIHHFHTNDMIAMGRAGARKMRVTTIGLIVGGAALAGIPGLSGFFSKEAIIGSLEGSDRLPFLVLALLATFMTAYYTFRMIFLVTRPNPDAPVEPDEEAHEPHHGSGEPFPIAAPILVLAAFAAALGFFGDSVASKLGIASVHHPGIADMAPAIGVALFGVLMAWLEFGRSGARQTGFIAKVPVIHDLFANRWYIDRIYRKLIVDPVIGIARLMYGFETRGFDGQTDNLANATLSAGSGVARSQVGRLQIYIGTAVVAIGAIALALGLWR
jgi:NADH-quinone oxidoreductase subunit L